MTAHGIVTISVWTTKHPRVNESFEVDFGMAWLKVAGWRAAAQSVSEQVKEELQTAQDGLSKAYTHTSAGVQNLMKDAARTASSVLKEVERVGLASLEHTSKTTDLMVAQSKHLSSQVSEAIQRHGHAASEHLTQLDHVQIREDIASYTRQISRALTEHAHVLTQAATGMDVRALAHEVQAYREKHLRDTQVKALHMWWKVRGGPPDRKNLKETWGKRKPGHCRGRRDCRK